MSGFVCVDASVAAKWVLPEDDSELALELFSESLATDTTLIAPPHMPVEVVNAIGRRVARGLITQAEAEEILATFLGFAVDLAVPAGLYEEALKLAGRFERPAVYDMHYVALAEIVGCELWTADQDLLNALRDRLPFVKPLRTYRP